MAHRLWFIVLLISYCSANSNSNSGIEWRTVETYFVRLGSRLDQLVLRIDHLDTRITRFTSLVQGRLDSVENTLSSSKLKMDLWTEELNRVDEQLSRKWKNLESKFDLLTPTIESKLENKLTIIQRDNRRHTESFSGMIIGLGQRVELSNERIANSISKWVNSTSVQNCQSRQNSSGSQDHFPSFNDTRLIIALKEFTNSSSELLKSTTASTLVSTKVTNMFEDLIERTDRLETGLKDAISISNHTRRELQDLRQTSSPSRIRSSNSNMANNGNIGSMSSSEAMSAVIVEALSSVESMSTALGRRLSDLSRSIEERFEMVSMTLNGFLESCIRIQDGAPLLEEHIAALLEKIIDGFENSTRTLATQTKSTSEEMSEINGKLELLLNGTTCTGQGLEELLSHYMEESQPQQPGGSGHPGPTTQSVTVPVVLGPSTNRLPQQPPDPLESSTADILTNSSDLTEEEKKLLWESLFPNQNVPD